MLYQLKRADISQLDLVTVYISVVRPVLEYDALCGILICLNNSLTALN